MIRIKVSSAGGSRDADLSQFLGTHDNTYEGCQFFVNSSIDEADYWFVFESPPEFDRECRTSRVVFLGAETMWGPGHDAESPSRTRYLKQFDEILTTQDLYWPNASFDYPFLPWMINANHGPTITARHTRDVTFFRALESLPKTELISVICSNKTYTEGHRLRLRFVEALASEMGDDLHWFGNGVRSLPEKWDAIAPYRFHVVLENQSAYGVFTEKIYDAFLGLSYPLYWGAPDLGRYFPIDSFTGINIRDLKGSVEVIREAIASDQDRRHVDDLLAAKRLTTDTHNVFIRVANLAMKWNAQSMGRTRRVTLTPAPPEGSVLRRALSNIRVRRPHGVSANEANPA